MKLGIGMGVSASRRLIAAAPSFPNTYSLDFSVDDYADCGYMTELDNISALTLSVWLKFDNLTGTQRIMGKWYNSVYRISLLTVGDEVYAIINNSYGITTDANLVADTWYHFAMIFDGTLTGNANRLKFYIDGTQKTMSFSGTVPATTYDFALNPEIFYLATDGFGTPNYYGGLYDEASIWNTALSAADVATLATAPSNLKTALGTTPIFWVRMGDSGTYFNSIWELPNQMKLDNYSKYSMEFDGIDDYITTGVDMSATDFSISFWIRGVYADNASDINTVCITSSISDPNRTIGRVVKEGGEGRLMIQGYDTTGVTFSTWRVLTDVLDDAWHHIVFTYVYDASTMANNKVYVYVDGVNFVWTKYGSTDTTPAMTMFAGATPTLQSAADLFIGSNKGTSRYFDGMIDSVALFDEVITSGNVTSIFAEGVPNDVSGLGISGLQAYYRMGESAVFSDNSEWQIPEQTKLSNWSSLSCYFDGINDYIQIPSSSIFSFGTADFGISFWIKTTDTDFNIMNPASSTGAGFWMLGVQTSKLRWNDSYGVSNLWEIASPSINFRDGSWHNIIVTRTSGSTTVYIDATLEGTFADVTDYTGVDAWRFGKGNIGGLLGSIDDVAIFNSSIASQVSAIYNGGEPSDLSAESGLQGYWKMGEGATYSTNWTIPDLANSNDGTSSGMDESGVVNTAPDNTSQGLSSGMPIAARATNAPDNINQANSKNMEELDRKSDTP